MKDCKTCRCYGCNNAKDTAGECTHCEECKAGEAHVESCPTKSYAVYVEN